MKTLFLQLTLLLSLPIFISCTEDLDNSRLNTETPEMSALDEWLRTSFTEPYNMEIKYKWSDYETDLTKNLIPPEEEKVRPLMEIMDQVWIKCYEEKGGEGFIKSYIPKLFSLIGGAGVNTDLTIVQGTAEAGRKVVLYEVNDFDPQDSEGINRFFHVMHHEFAHVLHQSKLYPTASYEEISKSDYRSDWYNVPEDSISQYLGKGFVSPYGMSSRDEDFVEVIAYILTRTQEEWNDYITQAGADSVKLRTKEAIVKTYFEEAWEIDIFALQAFIAEKIEEVTSTSAAAPHSSPFMRAGERAQFCSNCKFVHE